MWLVAPAVGVGRKTITHRYRALRLVAGAPKSRRKSSALFAASTSAAVPVAPATTRRRGYSVRDPGFGGHYSKGRKESDDGRNSIAMPIRSGGEVLGCVNLTWRMKALTVAQLVDRYGKDLRAAVADGGIADELARPGFADHLLNVLSLSQSRGIEVARVPWVPRGDA